SLLVTASLVAYTRPRIRGGDWLGLIAIGFVGHFVYQYCFIVGLAKTSVANSSLILACTPIAVALLSSALGHEPITGWHWAGAGRSLLGIYLIEARSAPASGASLEGDLLMAGALVCWAIYTVGSRPLLTRYEPVLVTGYSMAIGTVMFLSVSVK